MSQASFVNYTARQAKPSDLDQIILISKQLGFNQYKYLNHIMMNVDPQGIIVAELNETGEVIGMCAGVNLSPDLAFIGQYGVRPDYQGQRIGPAIWQRVLEHIGDRNIGLYARLSMAPKYQVNFPCVPKKRLICFTGNPSLEKLANNLDGVSIESVTDRNIDAVLEYDRHVCGGLDRRSYLEQLPTAPELVIAAAVRSGRVVGYGVVCRSTTNEAMIEGLYADDQSIAEILIGQLCDRLAVSSDQQMRYFCWNTNQKSISIAHELGLQQIKADPILFTKQVVDGDLDKIFCVSSRAFFPF